MNSDRITRSCRNVTLAIVQIFFSSGLLICACGRQATSGQQITSIDHSQRHEADVPVQVGADRVAPQRSENRLDVRELSGRVVDADGNPVADAQVALSSEKIGVLVSHGKLEPMRGDAAESRIVQTDSQGVFVLGERPAGSFDVIVAHDKGFAFVGSDAFADSNEIRL